MKNRNTPELLAVDNACDACIKNIRRLQWLKLETKLELKLYNKNYKLFENLKSKTNEKN